MRSHNNRRVVELIGGGVMLLVGFTGLLFVAPDPEKWNWFYTGAALAGASALLDRTHVRLKPALQLLGAGILLIGFWLRMA